MEKKKSASINMVPISLFFLLVFGCLKVLGLISWSWLTVIVAASVPVLIVIGFAGLIMLWVMFAWVIVFIAWVCKGLPKITIKKVEKNEN